MSDDSGLLLQLNRLFKPLTQAQWRADLWTKLKARGVPTDSWVSVVNAGRVISEEVTLGFANLEQRAIKLASGFLLPLSTGEFLTILASSFFGEDRIPAGSTVGWVAMTNAGASDITRDPDEILVGTPGSSASTKNYRNVSAVTLAAGKTTLVLVRAVATGASYNVPVGSITEVKRPLPNVTVDNPIFMGSTWITEAGTDIEEDGETNPPSGVKGRCRLKWHIVGLGTADAYRYYALTPPPGQTTSVTRAEPLSDYNPDTGTFEQNAVALYLAGPAGPVSAATVAATAARFEVPKRYPLGTHLYTRSASAVLVPIAGTLFYDLRYKLEDVQSRVFEAMALYQSSFRIGQPVFAAETTRVVMGSWDEASIDLDLAVKTNVPTGIGKVPVLTNNLKFVGRPVL